MKLIPDEILHLFIINPNLIEKETLKYIEKYQSTDEDFINRLNEIREFHRVFNENHSLWGYIELFPLKPFEANSRSSKLAAAHTKEKENRFKYFTSFISADNVVIMRVQKNDATNEYKLNLITEIPVDFKKVKIIIGGYGKEIIPDEYGVALVSDFLIDNDTNIHINLGEEN